MVKNNVVISIKKETLERLNKLQGDKVIVLSKLNGIIKEKTIVAETHNDVIKKLLDFFDEAKANGLVEMEA